MTDEIKRVESLAHDIMLLNTLGAVVTIQIDLVGVQSYAPELEECFNDAETIGIYIDSMILIRVMENTLIDYNEIFSKIAEITGDYEAIEGITGLIRINFRGQPMEITIQLDGKTRMPQLVQVADSTSYFPLLNLIRTRWTMATSMRV